MSNRKLEAEIEALLGGNKRGDARTFARLVRDVNPTDLGLSERETARRYDLKSRLQSALIRRFGDDLRIARDPQFGDGVVTLRHADLDLHFGHARLDALDEKARMRVGIALDTADDAAASSDGTSNRAVPRSTHEGASLLERATEALESWDFDGAVAHLEAARTTSEGPTAVALLLDIYVDRLGDDARAAALVRLELEVVRRDPPSRRRGATALARTGDVHEARDLLGESLDIADADALAAIASAHLDRDELHAGEAIAHELVALAPSNPARLALDERIRASHASRAAPAVAALDAALSLGDDAAIESSARAVLDVDPRNPGARGALRSLHERSRVRELERSRAAFEGAISVGDLVAARRALRSLGEDAREERARLDELERTVAERTRRAELDSIVAAFDRRAPDALDRFANVDSIGRDEIAKRLPQEPSIRWFLGFDASHRPGTSRTAVEAARLAIEVSHRLDATESSFDLGADARERLSASAAGRRLLGALDERRATEAAERAVDALDAAERALAQDDDAAAQATVSQLDADRLPAAARTRLARITAILENRRRLAELLGRAARSTAEGYPFEAAALTREALAAAAEAQTSRGDLEAAIVRFVEEGHARHPSVATNDIGPVDELVTYDVRSVDDAGIPCLDAGGALAYMTATAGEWLFVRELDVAASSVLRRVAIRLGPRIDAISRSFEAGVLRVVVARGRVDTLVVQIDTRPASLTFVGARPFRGPTGRPVEISTCVLAGNRIAGLRDDLTAREFLVFASDSVALRSVGREALSVTSIATGRGLEIVTAPFDGGPVHAYDESGTRRTLVRLSGSLSIDGLVGTTADRIYAMVGTHDSDDLWRLCRLDDSAWIDTGADVGEKTSGNRVVVAVDEDTKSIVVLLPDHETSELRLVSMESETVTAFGQVDGDAEVLIDAGRRIAAVAYRRDGILRVEPVHVAASRCATGIDLLPRCAPFATAGAFDCSPLPRDRRGPELLGRLRDARRAEVLTLAETHHAIRAALHDVSSDSLALVERALARFPDDESLLLARIEALLVIDRLDRARAEALALLPRSPETSRQHVAHLGFIASSKLGVDPAPFDAFAQESGEGRIFSCSFDVLHALRKAEPESQMDRAIHDLRHRLVLSAAAAEARDFRTVRETLLHAGILEAREIQTLGRLADAFVESPPSEPFRALLGIEIGSMFLEELERPLLGTRTELPLAACRLSVDDLGHIADRVRRGIDASLAALGYARLPAS